MNYEKFHQASSIHRQYILFWFSEKQNNPIYTKALRKIGCYVSLHSLNFLLITSTVCLPELPSLLMNKKKNSGFETTKLLFLMALMIQGQKIKQNNSK